jgi:hypothetical protein
MQSRDTAPTSQLFPAQRVQPVHSHDGSHDGDSDKAFMHPYVMILQRRIATASHPRMALAEVSQDTSSSSSVPFRAFLFWRAAFTRVPQAIGAFGKWTKADQPKPSSYTSSYVVPPPPSTLFEPMMPEGEDKPAAPASGNDSSGPGTRRLGPDVDAQVEYMKNILAQLDDENPTVSFIPSQPRSREKTTSIASLTNKRKRVVHDDDDENDENDDNDEIDENDDHDDYDDHDDHDANDGNDDNDDETNTGSSSSSSSSSSSEISQRKANEKTGEYDGGISQRRVNEKTVESDGESDNERGSGSGSRGGSSSSNNSSRSSSNDTGANSDSDFVSSPIAGSTKRLGHKRKKSPVRHHASNGRGPPAPLVISASTKRRRSTQVLTASAYHCEECGKGFVAPSLLKRHARGHTGERPNVCVTCNKRFGERHNLRRHMRTHKKRK